MHVPTILTGRRMIVRSATVVLSMILAAMFYVTFLPWPVSRLDELGSYVWRIPHEPSFGGFSGLEVLPDGTGFVALSDTATILRGRLLRENDRIIGIEAGPVERLASDVGRFLDEIASDTEGLAQDPDGRLFVSIESYHALNLFMPGRLDAVWISGSQEFERMQPNRGFEALAIDPLGRLLAIPERWPGTPGSVQLFRSTASGDEMSSTVPVADANQTRENSVQTEWDLSLALPVSPSFDPVGADFGPDDRLYVLERRFVWPLGFASQIRSFAYGPDGLSDERLLLRTRLLEHDNLESISVWRESTGTLRLTTISDDNFSRFQETEIVEYRIPNG